MAPEDDDIEDLYDDEFEIFDDEESDLDDDDSDLESAVDVADSDADAGSKIEEVKPAPREVAPNRPAARQQRFDSEEDPRDRQPRDMDSRDSGSREGAPRDFDRGPNPALDEEPAEEIKRPEAPANYRVHVYEYGEFKRTIDRPFTAEDSEAFASEYNRTSKSYNRFAVTGKEDVKPKKLLDDAKLPG
jgi:hypothetical protein